MNSSRGMVGALSVYVVLVGLQRGLVVLDDAAAWRLPTMLGFALMYGRESKGGELGISQQNGELRRTGAEPRAVTLAPLISCMSAIFALAFRPRMGVANRDHPFVHPSPCVFVSA